VNFDLLTAVLKSELPCAQRMILTVVLNHAGDDNRAWPSQSLIAAQAGLAERSVWQHLHELNESGWLRKVGSMGRVAVWEVKNPANSAGSPPQQSRNHCEIIPQILRDEEKPIPQILRDNPANSAGYPANSAKQSRNSCELTTQEPTKNQPLTTQEADKPPVAKVKTPKPDWREFNRQRAEQANSVTLPLTAPPEFRQAWQRWQIYRTSKAVEARIASEAFEWTQGAAEAGIRDCERAAAIHGWPAVIARMDQAMQGWRGFNFDKIQPANHNGYNSGRKPKHQSCL
jgi:hypothetical protein